MFFKVNLLCQFSLWSWNKNVLWFLIILEGLVKRIERKRKTFLFCCCVPSAIAMWWGVDRCKICWSCGHCAFFRSCQWAKPVDVGSSTCGFPEQPMVGVKPSFLMALPDNESTVRRLEETLLVDKPLKNLWFVSERLLWSLS